MEQPGLRPAPMWDACMIGDGFTHDATEWPSQDNPMFANPGIHSNMEPGHLALALFTLFFSQVKLAILHIYSYLKGKEKQNSCIYWFPLPSYPSPVHKPVTAGAGPGQSKKVSRIQLGSPTVVTGTQILRHHLYLPRVPVSRKLGIRNRVGTQTQALQCQMWAPQATS